MRIDQSGAEELLRTTLREKAQEAGSAVTLDDVRRDAARRSTRSRWRTTVAVAAAAALAVGVPVALHLRPAAESPSPALSPSPTPTRNTSPAPTEPASVLGRVPRGEDISIDWISSGTIHRPSGSDIAIPAGTWDAFTDYHGGWLLSGDQGLVQLNGPEQQSRLSPTGSRIVVSGDDVWTAFLAKGQVHIGATSHGDGENLLPVRSPDESGPIGFLSSQRVVYNGPEGQVLVLDPLDDSSTSLSGLQRASASTQEGDLIAGATADGECAVLSAATGVRMWTKPGWVPSRFSPDGRFLAAYQSATGGEFETVGILDARTGAVVATNGSAGGIRALPETPTAWEDDGSLLIPYRDGSAWTVLRLETDGTITRATQVFEGSPFDAGLVFTARP